MEQTPQAPTQAQTHRYNCPGCAANLLYEPKNGVLTCPYCGHREEIPASAEKVQERSYEEYLQVRDSDLKVLAAGALEVQCQSCGALVTFTPPETARKCDFCGAAIVAQPKAADPMLAPEGVLPFKIIKSDASSCLKHWLATRWFAPGGLKAFAHEEAIDGIYLPYWTYDANTVSHYTGQRGEYYYETESYTTKDARGNLVERTRQVRKTRWYPASGTVSCWFDDILVPATKALPEYRLNALEPWDLAEIKSYEPAYLSGFKAQRYQIDLKEGFELAKKIAARRIEADVRANIGGDEQRIGSISTHYSGITFKHLLFPVYAGAYRFNQKIYQIVVNGRTGEVQGDRPYSAVKIALFVAAVLLLVSIIALVGSLFD